MKSENLAVMIRERVKEYGDKTAMRYRDLNGWHSISYKEMGKTIETASKALIEINADEKDMIGIFSSNRPEWAIADFAIHSAKGVSVPIYATNTAKQAEYIIDDARIKIIFVGDQIQYDKVKSFSDSSSNLKNIIVFDEDVRLKGSDSMLFKDFIKIGEGSRKENIIEERLENTSPDDLATLIYTSGTTGDPKGVMLSHSNFFHQMMCVDAGFTVDTKDRSLCFLPLSHVYERSWSYHVFNRGAENNYVADPKEILEYMRDVRPTAMVSVPRLYEKIYATVYDRLEKAPGLKKKMFNWAVSTGSKYHYRKKDNKFIGPVLRINYKLADALILKKIRDVVGGHKNFFSAGGAPLSSDIEEFFFSAGLLICQGYGLTESSPMITYNTPGAFKFGTVGRAVPEVELKIGKDGEIMAKGPNIMRGYFNKPDATKEALAEGWLKTGDVGVIDKDGYLRITDRIKDLIITSQGKNIAPQHIETLVGMDHYIEQIAVIGDRRKFISALIVPNFEALEGYARENNISFSSREELIAKQEINDFYKKRIECQSAELANYEKIKRFALLANEFTQDGGELTPTLKVKRKAVAEKYKDIIDGIYSQ